MPRIFILEDDLAISQLIRDLCEQQKWIVTSQSLCASAVQAMRDFRPDLALFDVSLPDGDGFDVCRQVRADKAVALVPVIFMTSKGDVKSRLEGFKAGAQDYIPKPFFPEELIARICAHLEIKKEKDSLAQKNRDLEIHQRLRQDLTDMIVHDLRAPLSTIRVTLEWVRSNGLINAGDYSLLLKNAESVTDFALFMVNDILDLSSGNLTINPGTVEIGPMLERLQAVFEAEVRGRHLTMVIERPKELAPITSDSMLIFRSLVNLISNAIKFSLAKGKITVRVTQQAKSTRFEILDEGPGILPADREKIFEKYFRSNNPETHAAPGSGIGLAFVRLAANTLSGKVWAEENKPTGSRFILELPNTL